MAESIQEKDKPENVKEKGKLENENQPAEKKFKLFVVPWTNSEQFLKVYDYLFSPEIAKKRWALDQITVWETRCHPSLPAAIEASFGLTSAIVQDVLWTNGASVNQQLDIQYIYSSAITRFVNLIVELHEYTGTMSRTAKGLGIPTYIVDLRNEASHEVTPSLSCLRIAADTAMKFLKKTYWDKEAEIIMNYIQKPIDVTGIRDILQEFLKYTYSLLYKELKMKKEFKYRDPDEKLQNILRRIRYCIKKDKRLFIKVLVSDGIFIPVDEDFRSVLCDADFMEFQSEEDTTAYVSRFDTSIIPKIPDFHEVMWHPVLILLNMYDAVPMFLEALLKTQGYRTVAGQKLLISWVMTILRIHTVGAYFENPNLRKIFKRKGIVVNWHSMFYAAVANPCKYTAFIFPLIFCNLDLNKKGTQRVLKLVAIYLGQASDENDGLPKNHSVFTVQQLKQIKNLQKAQREKQKGGFENCIWSPASDDDYKTWPIGQVINPLGGKSEEHLEGDDFDFFGMKDDFVEKFILVSNKNDSEVDNVLMDSESPMDTLEVDALQEIEQRKSFLYKK